MLEKDGMGMMEGENGGDEGHAIEGSDGFD